MSSTDAKLSLVQDEVYSRADASLWDDSELVRLWNEQLGRLNQKDQPGLSLAPEPKELSEEEASEGSAAYEEKEQEEHSSENEEERNLNSSSNSSSSTSTRSSLSASARSCSPSECSDGAAAVTAALGSKLQLQIQHLPRAVGRLVTAFYQAGYECGRYAARVERKSRKTKHVSLKKHKNTTTMRKKGKK